MPQLRVIPGRVPIKDMDERQLSRFLADLRADFFREGQDGYDHGIGFWFGIVNGVAKFSVGDSSGNKLTWDGSTLAVVGDITLQANAVGEDELQDGAISGGKLAAGSVTADKIDVSQLSAITADMGSLTAGNIVLNDFIRSGQTAYDTGTGFWLGKDSGTPKFSIGDSAGAHLTWDGSTLTIFDAEGADKTIDHLILKGDSNTNAAVGRKLGSTVATTNASISGDDWQLLRSFTTDFTGSFRLMVEAKRVDTLGAPPVDGKWRLKNGAGSIVHTESFSSTVFANTFSVEATIAAAGETWTVEGLSNTDLATYIADTALRDIEVLARFNHATIS